MILLSSELATASCQQNSALFLWTWPRSNLNLWSMAFSLSAPRLIAVSVHRLRLLLVTNLRRSLLAALASGLAIGIILPVTAVGPAAAQQPKVQIQELRCEGNPETIVLKNTGSASQSLAGWKLQSDPAGESFDLSAIGNLAAGASVLVEAGPGTTATFIWSQQPVFRDNDATDYARLVDNNGQTVHQLACGQPRSPTPAPATTTPTPPSAGQIPNGGGPVSSEGFSTPLLMVALGGWMIAGGLLAVALPWLRLAKPVLSGVEGPRLARDPPAADPPPGLS